MAADSGILPGDKIVAVDGERAEFASAEEAKKRLRGKAGEKVVLTVLHEDSISPEDIPIIRAVIRVKVFMNIAIIKPFSAHIIEMIACLQLSPIF